MPRKCTSEGPWASDACEFKVQFFKNPYRVSEGLNTKPVTKPSGITPLKLFLRQSFPLASHCLFTHFWLGYNITWLTRMLHWRFLFPLVHSNGRLYKDHSILVYIVVLIYSHWMYKWLDPLVVLSSNKPCWCICCSEITSLSTKCIQSQLNILSSKHGLFR